MRIGLTSIVLALGLALGSAGHAQETAPTPAAGTTPTEAIAENTPPVTAAAPLGATEVADPTLKSDGTPNDPGTAGIGQPVDAHLGLQDQVTPTGREAHFFHNMILLPIIAVISLFVLFLLVYVVVRYRRAANPEPSKTSHNTVIEIVWTLVPVLILLVIAVPSIRLLAHQYKPAPDNAVTLKAIGNQWFWSYEYPDNGDISITANMLRERAEVGEGERYRTDADGPRLLATDNRVVLPVGVPIRLITTANDVIHSWAMPAFWIKLDAIPGRLNETTFTIEKPGVYYGQCSELCGARHAYMPIVVEAVSPEVFERWVRSKGGSMPGDAQPSDAAPAQAGADVDDATATTAEGTVATGDETIDNSTATPATTSQPATGSVE